MRRTNHRNLVNVGILSGRIPLISLVQFIAVAEHLNFRHAAKALGISQVIVVRCALLIGVRRLAVAVAVLQRSRHRAHAVELLRPHDRKRHPSPGVTVTNPRRNCHAPKPANPGRGGAGGVLEKSIHDYPRIIH